MSDFKIYEDERIDIINADLSLIQKKDGLTFGTDAYLLSAFAKKANSIADLGSGTGVASFLSLAYKKANKAIAFEIQECFCDLIKRNAELNNFTDNVSIINQDIRYYNYSSLSESIDVVISNPPYMRTNAGAINSSEIKDIARRENNGDIFAFCESASKLLKFGGYFYVVYLPERISDLFEALRASKLEPKRLVPVYPKLSSSPCLILVEAKKGASPSLKFSKPLIIYDNNNSYTDDMNKIYTDFTLEHLF